MPPRGVTSSLMLPVGFGTAKEGVFITSNQIRERTMIEPGREAPAFCLPSEDGEEICLQDLKGKWVVLYFYPKDNTSG